MARTYKDIDFIVGFEPYTENEEYAIHFKNGDIKTYKNEPKFAEKFYDNHTQFAGEIDGRKVIIYARFVASWEDNWTEGETTPEYYDRIKREVFGSDTLADYLEKCEENEEITVFDKDYDVETYFYNSKRDEWDKAMFAIAKKLDVISISNRGVTVNLSDVIEKNIKNFDGLFIHNDVDAIMEDIEAIFSGCVSEEWLTEFANKLKA